MSARKITTRRRMLAPEVIQTSAMDCGPASLKCLLEGFGIRASYGRLREACQTEVDGTSIDTIEAVAVWLGLEAEQVMLPEELLFDSPRSLPALVVALTPNGSTHFAVVWRRHGPFIQVMDPATGRRWLRREELAAELYKHSMTIPAADWREWAGSGEFAIALRRRLRELGIARRTCNRLIEQSLDDPGWRRLAALDAAARLVNSLVRSGAINRGVEAQNVLESFLTRAALQGELTSNPAQPVVPTRCDPPESLSGIETRPAKSAASIIPESYWTVRAAPADSADPDGLEHVRMTGVVLVQARGRRVDCQTSTDPAALPPKEVSAALTDKPDRPAHQLMALLRGDGLLRPTAVLAALALAAGGVFVEALLFQGLFNLGPRLTVEQRMGAVLAVAAFSLAMLCLELPIVSGLLGAGRRLETRLRLAFLEKIPRLGDRYFQSRLISDMADRSHNAHTLRLLPGMGGQFLRFTFELALTAAGIVWLDPRGALATLSAATAALAVPLLMQSRLIERDLRVRSHNGALGRFYLDALQGLVAIRTHGAALSLRREQESLLVEWMRSSFALVKAALTVEAIQSVTGFGLAAWLLFDHVQRGGQGGSALLLVYWALNLPALGQEIALIVQQYPAQRNVTLRAVEPLGAPEDSEPVGDPGAITRPQGIQPERIAGNGMALAFEGISVRAGGHPILDEIDLDIRPGSHIAIVGSSGAGKSSFVGLLLGWHKPSAGRLRVDGEELNAAALARLRAETAWIDPAIHLWNRSLIDNLLYGSAEDKTGAVGAVIEGAHLRVVLDKLPGGLQSELGEGGGMLSGGEGQRVRLGRAMLRGDARLVILDEPFRGLDRERRHLLMARARELWSNATLLAVTHDIAETLAFERVLVIEGGKIVEDDSPRSLATKPGSRYSQLLETEDALRSGLWSDPGWRRLRIEAGQATEISGPAAIDTTDKSETAADSLADGGRRCA